MSCLDCGKINADEAYLQAKQQAKQNAIETGTSYAIWKEGGDWFYGPAETAIADGKPVTEFLSPLP